MSARARGWARLAAGLVTSVALAVPAAAMADPGTPAPQPSARHRSATAPRLPAPVSSQTVAPRKRNWETASQTAAERVPYPGNPESEAALVGDEDSRLVQVNTVDSLARWSSLSLNKPYRLATGSAYTLVLTPRTEPYRIADLLALEPQTFVRQPDGSYLLSENLVVQTGATLNLTAPGGLRLRLASDADGFVSIVNFGGRLNITGTDGAPVQVTSWDRHGKGPDTRTADGRAYVRSIGGQVMFKHVNFTDLGFWSGRTGGVALTGTDRPNSGALNDLGKTLQVGKRAARQRAAAAAASPQAPQPQVGLNGVGKATLSQVLPAGNLPVPTVSMATPQYSFVSAALDHVTTTGNAFGLFVASANGVDIRNSTFDRSLVDGLVMHRYVTNAVVQSAAADDNAGDGIVLARATTGIVLSEVRADGNHRNGVSLSGLPLANGPSATGISVGSYGNNSVSNSIMSGNGRYGIEVLGGINIGVQANALDGNDMGIVVRDGAKKVTVVGNRVTNPTRQGIAIRDGVSQALVTGNIVSGGLESVYVRDSDATISRNTLTGATMHAVSFVGTVAASTLTENTISGRGPSAIDGVRASDLHVDRWANDTHGWNDTTPFVVTLKKFLQPLTTIWLLLAALLLFTAVRGTRHRWRRGHPYADKAPVSDGMTLPPLPRQAGAR
jgi:hypothetical protein